MSSFVPCCHFLSTIGILSPLAQTIEDIGSAHQGWTILNRLLEAEDNILRPTVNTTPYIRNFSVLSF